MHVAVPVKPFSWTLRFEFHIIILLLIFFFFRPSENGKIILSSQAIQKQGALAGGFRVLSFPTLP